MKDMLALVGALSIACSALLTGVALFLAYRSQQALRPYRDEHQGAA